MRLRSTPPHTHVGHVKEDFKGQDQVVDSWTEVVVTNDVIGEVDIKDVCNGEQIMEEKCEEKYLGDVISIDGRNLKNIKASIAKGTGIVRKILTILDGIPFGKRYFEIGLIFRNCFLVSSVVFNSEVSGIM